VENFRKYDSNRNGEPSISMEIIKVRFVLSICTFQLWKLA